ncbi:helix-turn-helix domain-containing protein [Acuticoccus sp. M5D2P5]|nr:helix-turn-helix domain-containing protein [Acuticoccus kalidii]
MLADGTFTVNEVAKRLNISPATLYRYLPAARATINCKVSL